MSKIPVGHPFRRSLERYVDGEREILHFVDSYKPIYEQHRSADPRFQTLDRFFGVEVSVNHIEDALGRPLRNAPPPTVQFHFRERSLGLSRRDTDGIIGSESGPTLVYSFGPQGAVAVMLYCAKGNLGSAIESSILLRHGFISSAGLLSRMRQDLRDWTSYAHVTAIDGDPTWTERLRVWWLRVRQPKFMENKFQPAVLPAKIWAVVDVTIRLVVGAALGAGFKVVAPGVVGFLAGLIFS